MSIIHEHIRDIEFKCNLNIYNKMHREYDRRRENIHPSKIIKDQLKMIFTYIFQYKMHFALLLQYDVHIILAMIYNSL